MDSTENLDILAKEDERRLKLTLEAICDAKYSIYNNKMSKDAVNNLQTIYKILCENYTGEIFLLEEIQKNKNNEMNEILSELLNVNAKNDFYDILLHSLLSEQTFTIALKIIIIVLETRNYIPDNYKSKMFAWFITDRLLKEIFKIYSKEDIDGILKETDGYEQILRIIIENQDKAVIADNSIIRYIIKLLSIIVRNNERFIYTLYTVGSFNIINTMVIRETALFYNEIFNNVEIDEEEEFKAKNKDYTPELYKNFGDSAIYAIERKGFPEDEPILRNKQIFKFRKFKKLKSATKMHEEIYKLLKDTIYRELSEIFIEDFYNVMSYKKIEYMDESMIREFKRVYEIINNPGKNDKRLNKVIRDNNKQRIESLLKSYLRYIKGNGTKSTEIFKMIITNININISEKANHYSILIIGRYLHGSEHMLITEKLKMKDVFRGLEFEMGHEEVVTYFEILKCLYRENNINSYKPTYVMILRVILVKILREEEYIRNNGILGVKNEDYDIEVKFDGISTWIQEYFRDFISFLEQSRINVAEIMIGSYTFEQKRAKKVEYKLEDNFYGIEENNRQTDEISDEME